MNEDSKSLKLQELQQLTAAGKIRTENRRVSCITCDGYYQSPHCIEFTVCLDPLPDAPYWHNEICLKQDQLAKFLNIFRKDADETDSPNKWTLDDFSGKYVRLLWQVNAPEDMHELADEEDLFAVKHIVNEGYESTYFL